MKHSNIRLILLTFIISGGATAAFAVVQSNGPNLLDSLNRGMWQFRAIGGGDAGTDVARLCVDDVTKLAQIQHKDFDCTQYVVRSSATTITISYSCRGKGQGLTTIRKESNKLIHIDSQGIRDNSPFSFTVEARNSGPC
jgi:hypothetical protein